MPLKRAEAGRRVAVLVESLSDRLVADEDDAKDLMDAVFSAGIPAVSKLARKAHAASGRAGVEDAAMDLVELARERAGATGGPFSQLIDSALLKGLESIREELLICEQSLAPKFEGIAGRACDRVDAAGQQLVDLALTQYGSATQRAMGWFAPQVSLELTVSRSAEESEGQMLSRLISPTPVALPQHAGRGIWWKVLEYCNRHTREVEFATVNAARTEAMLAFNELWEAIDADRV